MKRIASLSPHLRDGMDVWYVCCRCTNSRVMKPSNVQLVRECYKILFVANTVWGLTGEMDYYLEVLKLLLAVAVCLCIIFIDNVACLSKRSQSFSIAIYLIITPKVFVCVAPQLLSSFDLYCQLS